MGAAEIKVHQFGAFKSTVSDSRSREGCKLKIAVRKVTIVEKGKVEKAHSHRGFGKKAHGKGGPVEIAPVKAAAGKINAFKVKIRGAEVFDYLPFKNIGRYPGRFLIPVHGVDCTGLRAA
jgi:hypothetical protein